jgi:DNA repair ATPase RecN
MTTRVEIKNFKTMKDVTFEWEGYATLLGSNFIGKSGVPEAIDAALNNRSGTDFIRWGEKYCEVRIIREGLDILWHKEPGNNFYLINGETYDKINNDLPTEIKKAGFGPLVVSGESLDLNYSKQFTPLFLVDAKKKGYVTDLLASMYKIDTVYKADGLCKKDLRNAVSKLKVRSADKMISEENFDKLSKFPSIKSRTKELYKTKKYLQGEYEAISEGVGLLRRLAETSQACRKLKPVTLLGDTDPSSMSDIQAEIEKLGSWFSELKSAENKVTTLGEVESVPDTSIDSSDLADLSSEIKAMSRLRSNFVSLATTVKSLEPSSGLSDISSEDIQSLSDDCSKMASMLSKSESCERVIESLESVSSMGDTNQPDIGFEELDKMSSLLKKFNTKAIEVKSAKEELVEIDTKIEEVESQLSEFDSCPVCGGEIHGDH